jgi:Tfp pilus assembly protein PilN
MVEQQYDEANRQVDQANQLEDRKTGLLHKVELSTTLLERVPSSRLLAVMTNYLPKDASLTNVLMQVQEVDVKPAEPKKAGDDVKKIGKSLADKNSPPAAPTKVKRVVFRLDGLAQTDVQVAEYLNRLAADPLFEDPDLQFSEAFPYEEGTILRRFQVTFRLSPRAEQIMDMSTTKGKLTAAPAADAGKGAS